jgi:hypothetical protein
LLPVNVKVPKKFAIWMPDQDFTESSVHCGSCAKTEPKPIDIKQNIKSNTAKPNERSILQTLYGFKFLSVGNYEFLLSQSKNIQTID